MPLTDQWQGYANLPDFPDPATIPTDLKNLFDFLASRAVPRYGSPAERDAELSSPTEGMLCAVGAEVQMYTGTEWGAVWSDTGWVMVPTTSGVTSHSTYPMQVRKVAGQVRIRGGIAAGGTTTGANTIGTIPAGFLPERDAFGTYWTTTAANLGTLRITSAGAVTVQTPADNLTLFMPDGLSWVAA